MISSHMHIMDNGQVYKSNRRMDDVLPPSEGTACWRLDKPGGPLRLTPAGMLYCAMQIFIRALLVRKPLTMWKSKLFFTNKARTYLNIRIPNIVFHNNSPHQYRQTCIWIVLLLVTAKHDWLANTVVAVTLTTSTTIYWLLLLLWSWIAYHHCHCNCYCVLLLPPSLRIFKSTK